MPFKLEEKAKVDELGQPMPSGHIIASHKQQAALMNTNRSDLVARLLMFLAGRPEEVQRFVSLSGVAPADMRARLNDAAFQDGLLDYVLANEPLLLAFCDEAGEDPAFVARLAQGGQPPEASPW